MFNAIPSISSLNVLGYSLSFVKHLWRSGHTYRDFAQVSGSTYRGAPIHGISYCESWSAFKHSRNTVCGSTARAGAHSFVYVNGSLSTCNNIRRSKCHGYIGNLSLSGFWNFVQFVLHGS